MRFQSSMSGAPPKNDDDVDMSEEQEDAEMKDKQDYNYLNDESAIRIGGGDTPPFSEEKNGKIISQEEDFPEDDVDPMVYMDLVKKWNPDLRVAWFKLQTN